MIEVDSEKIGITNGVMGKWMKCILLAFVALAFSTARSVETADFANGTGTNGWVVGNGSYVSPAYPSSVSRIEIECANSVPDRMVTVFATSSNGRESQIAAFVVVSTSATFTFAAGTDFRSLRIETGEMVGLLSVSVSLFPALLAVPVSGLDGGVYMQDFDSLASVTATTGAKDWLNGITLPHWQAWKGGDAVTSFNYNGGKVKAGGLYALATEQKSGERALGGYSTKEAAIVWGIAFTNDTDVSVRLVGVKYSAQQWGFANTSEHLLSLSGLVMDHIDWIANVNDGWFGCCDTVARVFDSEGSHPVPVVSQEEYSPAAPPRIDPGEVLMLRWTIHQAAGGYSAMMAIDDLHVTFVRESRPFVIHVVNGGKMRKRGFRKCM